MFSGVKNLIRILVATAILIIIVVLVVKVGNRNNDNLNKALPNIGGVQTIKKNEPENNLEDEYESGEPQDIDDYMEGTDDYLEEILDAPDTASTNTIFLILGSVIITSGIIYVHKYNN